MGYDQYTVPDDCSCRTYFCCFPLALENTLPWPFVPILSKFFEEQRTQTTLNAFWDCCVHFFRQPVSKQLYIFFTCVIKTHIPISVFAQRDFGTAKLNNIFQTFLTCAEIFLFSQGMNVKSKVPILLEVLDNYDLQNLVEFFDAAQTGVELINNSVIIQVHRKKRQLFMQL